MDHDSASSSDDRLVDVSNLHRPQTRHSSIEKSTRLYLPNQHTNDIASTSAPIHNSMEKNRRASVKIIERSLSSQVMEYYHMYSQNSNLDRYFSMPDSTFSSEVYKDYLKPQEAPKPWENVRKSLMEPEKSSSSDIPRERRRWVRPPLIGQPSGASPELLTSNYVAEVTPELEEMTPALQDLETISEEWSEQRKDSLEPEAKAPSPTSSVTSHKPLEWDSGADVGYHNALPRGKDKDKGMYGTIERIALARGLALRLDPEGTTGSTVDPAGSHNSPSRRQAKPAAHSTRLANDISQSEGEIEITPIVKANVPGIITGKVSMTDDAALKSTYPRKKKEKAAQRVKRKYTECEYIPKASEKYITFRTKSISMNVLAFPLAAESLKKSQSELNIRDDDDKKRNVVEPLNFPSTSSITTIIPEPLTCDKDTQTSLIEELARRESIGIQVPTEEVGRTTPDELHEKYADESSKKNLEYREETAGRNSREHHREYAQEQCQRRLQQQIQEHPQKQLQEVPQRYLAESREEYMQNNSENHLPKELSELPGEHGKLSEEGAQRSLQKYCRKRTEEPQKEPENNHQKYPEERVQKNSQKYTQKGLPKSQQTYRVQHSQKIPQEEFQKSPKEPLQKSSTEPAQEEKPPLPKRITSLPQNPPSILKNSENNSKRESEEQNSCSLESDGGRASNSFEYFPGHIYQNVPAGGDTASHVSSVDTGRSHSTMPNTSSSLEEKLWGDSDSLRRDLERSLNVLKILVDANQCDTNVKKRLIHHVIRRLITAKYADDKIEHDLNENVPWNPDNARKKVYRTEMIQTLANKQKQQPNSTEDSSEDWKPRQRSSSANRASHAKKNDLKSMNHLVVNSSENSDLCEGRNTDRTDGMQDGRKARMGLRTEDKLPRHLDTEKSSHSSECFVPQQISFKSKPEQSKTPVKTPSSSSRGRTEDDKLDWRLLTTMSERQFELERCKHRADASTRLIDYIEMEKKNQLIWINSEINHLGNLKMLLEEPIRHEDERRPANSSDLSEQTLNDQWSSHGNLAKTNELRNFLSRKLNSCTQTDGSRYSKSDRTKILSAVENLMRAHEPQTTNVSAQTVMPIASPDPSRSWSPRRGCLVHGNKKGNCHCPSPSLVIQNGTAEVEKAAQTTPTIKKEAKNWLNDAYRSESNVNECQDKPSEAETNRLRSHCHGCRCGSGEHSLNSEKLNSTKESGDSLARLENSDRLQGDKRREERTRRVRDEKKDEREVKSCRTCGITYTGVNRKCQCILSYLKPIAYELNFINEKRRGSFQDHGASSSTPASDVQSCWTEDCYCGPLQSQLTDYLKKNKPDFVNKIEARKQYMSEISQLRQLKKEKRTQFLAIASPKSLITSAPNVKKPTAKSQRKITDKEMKARLRLRYLRLNEVKHKRRQKEKEEQAKKNHLMAKMFCKKLQQKVLNGQVSLSPSVSVISNL